MVDRNRLAVWLLGGIGVVLVVVLPDAVGETASRDLLLGLSLVGAAFLWGAALWDDAISRARRDERAAEIHYRAGYNTSLALAAILGTFIFVMTNLDVRLTVRGITGIMIAGAVVYFGSVAWFRRAM